MSINALLAKVEESSRRKEGFDFEIGDTVDVHVRIVDDKVEKDAKGKAKAKAKAKAEEEKERIQIFSGIVIARRGRGTNEMFTVRRIVDGEGVERIFPVHSPKIVNIEIKKRAIVRRAKLYYLRDRIGKKAFTLKERPITKETVGRKRSRIKARKEKSTAEAAPTETPAAAKTRKPRVRKKKGEAGDAKA